MRFVRSLTRTTLLVGGVVTALATGCGKTAGDRSDGGADSGADASTLRADGGAPGDGGVPVGWQDNFHPLPVDPDGWSVPAPSSDSRIMYVSTSGSDATGKVYSAGDPEIGSDPRSPAGTIQPYKTIDAALAQARSGYPDWILLRRGDTWTRASPIQAKAGRSVKERAIIASYGGSTARPMIESGTADGIDFTKNVSFVAVLGVQFYANQRDPDSSDFVGFDSVGTPRGFWIWAGGSAPNSGIQIENCLFRFYANNVIQGPQTNNDIIIRRSEILDDYSTTSHSQGIYTHESSILLEENVFDHNGWYKQSYTTLNDPSEGQATFFNHNTYFENTYQTIFRRNLFLRASSIGTKFTANPPGSTDQIVAKDVLIDNNFYLEGEIGISAGGNTDNGTGPRFQDFIITNNVFDEIGRARPTNRALGWGIDVNDWEGGRVTGNYFLDWGYPDVTNVWALQCRGNTSDVNISNNVVWGLHASQYAITIDGDPKSSLTVSGNQLQMQGTKMKMISTEYTGANTFSDNVYYTDQDPSSVFRVQGNGTNFTGWVSKTGATGSSFTSLTYSDPGRTIETYMKSLGKDATVDAFVQQARSQSRDNWRKEYTAQRVNDYLRAGFTTK